MLLRVDRAYGADVGLVAGSAARALVEVHVQDAVAEDADRFRIRSVGGLDGAAARDLFGEGRNSEEEGERLLRAQEYESAQLAFSRAASLFLKAQELSWEERVRRSSISGAP